MPVSCQGPAPRSTSGTFAGMSARLPASPGIRAALRARNIAIGALYWGPVIFLGVTARLTLQFTMFEADGIGARRARAVASVNRATSGSGRAAIDPLRGRWPQTRRKAGSPGYTTARRATKSAISRRAPKALL